MPAEWRLIVDGPLDGEWNMAVDRALQLTRESGSAPPTLRLYRWARPTVSLGRFQDTSSIDLDTCLREGVDVVRRFTGGRGVLHDKEVTYSITASVEDGMPRGVGASYRFLCEGLKEAYVRLGVDAVITTRTGGIRGSAACYLHATKADLCVGSSKLTGSAQTWVGSTCLQHGSFVIGRDAALEAEVFCLDDAGRRALVDTSVTLTDLLPEVPELSEIVDKIAEGIAAGLDVTIRPAPLSSDEVTLAESLLGEVYVDLS